MFTIALCDDDPEIVEEVRIRIMQHFKKINKTPVIKTFSNGKNLVASVSDGDRFDLFFLDIEMPEMNGIEVASHLRTFQPSAGIIFLTSHFECADEGYKVKALRYIQKRKLSDCLPEALDEAVKAQKSRESNSLLVPHYNNLTRILYSDIIYVQKTLRSIQIVTASQDTVKDNRGLKDIYKTINDPRFIFIERSTFINLDYARQIDGIWMVLKGGERLPISRPMMSTVKAAIIQLWGAQS